MPAGGPDSPEPRGLWQAPRSMQIRPLPFTSRRWMLRALLGAAAMPMPLSALAGFNFFLSEYTATRDELQAQIAASSPVSIVSRRM